MGRGDLSKTGQAAVEKELRRTGGKVTRLHGQLDDAIAERDRAILRATKLGMTRRQVAAVADVTVGRVQQIVDAAERSSSEKRSCGFVRASCARSPRGSSS